MKKNIKPTQKIVFLNNKGGVGKTTLSFNIAYKFADMGYKTLLVDADPQCNLTLLSLGVIKYGDDKIIQNRTIYHIFENLVKGTGDFVNIEPINLKNDLDILPGHLNFGEIDDFLVSAYNEMNSASSQRGFIATSALQRYLEEISLKNKYDIIILDVSPSMAGAINKTVLLSSDFFISVCNPDLFSKQGLINLESRISTWLRERKDQEFLSRRKDILAKYITYGQATYLGYIINEYNVYREIPIVDYKKWLQDIYPCLSKLATELSKNGLTEISAKKPIGMTQDYGRIAAMAQQEHKPMYEFDEKDMKGAEGSMELLSKCKIQLQELVDECVSRLEKWGN